MERKIKMIGLDLDGTLLNGRKELTPYTKQVLAQAIAQGVVVLVATGRPISAIPKELLEFPGMRYVLTANGARIVDQESKETIVEHLLSVESAQKVLEVFRGHDTIHEIFIDGKGYTCQVGMEHLDDYLSDPSMKAYMKETRTPMADVMEYLLTENQSLDKVHAIYKDLEERKEAIGQLQSIAGIEVTAAFGNTIEVNREGTNKGLGLLRLGECLGIAREEIMAFGDGMNDYEMLKTVGFGVAMENGHPKVKEVADYVTGTNEEEGVAKAIERFVIQ